MDNKTKLVGALSTIGTIASGAVINICHVYSGNYSKRRRVGFDVFPSISGAYQETKQYVKDNLNGVEHHPTVEAIIFGKD